MLGLLAQKSSMSWFSWIGSLDINPLAQDETAEL